MTAGRYATCITFNSAVVVTTEKPGLDPQLYTADSKYLQFGRGRDHGETSPC